jgi:hypothetical protein
VIIQVQDLVDHIIELISLLHRELLRLLILRLLPSNILSLLAAVVVVDIIVVAAAELVDLEQTFLVIH